MKSVESVYLKDIKSFFSKFGYKASPVCKTIQEETPKIVNGYFIVNSKHFNSAIVCVRVTPLTFYVKTAKSHFNLTELWQTFMLENNTIEYLFRMQSYLLKQQEGRLKSSCNKIRKQLALNSVLNKNNSFFEKSDAVIEKIDRHIENLQSKEVVR